MEEEAKTLPEQEEDWNYTLSKEFRDFIDDLGEGEDYIGVVSNGGEYVNVAFMESKGFNSHKLSLGAYLTGKEYATLRGKTTQTYVEEDDLEKFKEEESNFVKILMECFGDPVTYEGVDCMQEVDVHIEYIKKLK